MSKVLALAGGVGGAKLANGLALTLAADELTVAVNTGDDFVHLGLMISPDLDSVMYKLARLNDPERGWGRAGESFAFMEALAELGGETWFTLGDRDLATHVERTGLLAEGEPLSEVTMRLCRRLGIAPTVTPMSDDPVRTVVETVGGCLGFQDYFVRAACAPAVTGFAFEGAERARPAPALACALGAGDLAAIVICPSNPYVSIGPILAMPEVAAAIHARRVPAVAVSPIVGGAALKGPAAKMMRELGREVSATAVARHYGGLIDGIVIDEADAGLAGEIEAHGVAVRVAPTVMRTAQDERFLAEATLDFASSLTPRGR